MKIFIDESGDFGWCPPRHSLFCALTVADRTFDGLVTRFDKWKTNQPRRNNDELKGKNLLPLQQASFVYSVILATEHTRMTLAGTNTALFPKTTAEQFREDSANTLSATAEWASENNKPLLVDFYSRMARWLEQRSAENVLWVCGLVHVIRLAIQHAIIQFAEEEDDCEFENIEILIDRSFIKKESHDNYWRDWLRSSLLTESENKPLLVIKEWSERDHPFNRKYRRPNGLIDSTDLYRNHMRFEDSAACEGIQIADICANIAYRHYTTNKKYRPYRLLRSRLCGKGQTEMHTRILDERSLVRDAPENHVHPYSEDDLAAHAKGRADD